MFHVCFKRGILITVVSCFCDASVVVDVVAAAAVAALICMSDCMSS